MIISFLIGMVGIILLQYSLYKMKGVINYKNQNKLGRIFSGPNADLIAMIRFFKSMFKNNCSELRGQYIVITIIHIGGLILFIGAIFYIVKYV